MSKISLSPAFAKFRGKLGDLVILELNGQVIARRCPQRKAKRTAAEKAQNDRMRQAAAYGKAVNNDPIRRAEYAAFPHKPGLGPFHIAVRDFHHAPVVEDIDASAYRGKTGDVIRVAASDDTGIIELSVWIKDLNDGAIENGQAKLDESTGRWCYAATRDLPSGQAVTLIAIAKDRPGNTGKKECLGYAR